MNCTLLFFIIWSLSWKVISTLLTALRACRCRLGRRHVAISTGTLAFADGQIIVTWFPPVEHCVAKWFIGWRILGVGWIIAGKMVLSVFLLRIIYPKKRLSISVASFNFCWVLRDTKLAADNFNHSILDLRPKMVQQLCQDKFRLIWAILNKSSFLSKQSHQHQRFDHKPERGGRFCCHVSNIGHKQCDRHFDCIFGVFIVKFWHFFGSRLWFLIWFKHYGYPLYQRYRRLASHIKHKVALCVELWRLYNVRLTCRNLNSRAIKGLLFRSHLLFR